MSGTTSTYPLRIIAIALAYYLVGKLSLLLAIPPGYAVAIWPSAGIALACILCYGYRAWPGVLLGSAATNLAQASHAADLVSWIPYLLVVTMGAAAALQAVVGTFLIRRLAGPHAHMSHGRRMLLFFIHGGLLACLTAPTLSIGLLSLTGQIAGANIMANWVTWWLGDVLGVMMAAPIILAWLHQPESHFHDQRWRLTLSMSAMFGLTLALVMGGSSLEIHRLQSNFNQQAGSLQSSFHREIDLAYGKLQRLSRISGDDAAAAGETPHDNALKSLTDHPWIAPLEWFATDSHLAEAAQAATQARDSGMVTTAARPKGPQSTSGFPLIGYAIVAAYHRASPPASTEDRRQALSGYWRAGLQGQGLVQSALKGLDTDGLAYRIIDLGADDAPDVLLASTPDFPSPLTLRKPALLLEGVALSSRETSTVGGRTWAFEVVPTQTYFARHRAFFAQWIQILCVLLTGITGMLVMASTDRPPKPMTFTPPKPKER